MKTFIACMLLAVSLSAHSREQDVTEVLSNFLGNRTHYGNTPAGAPCSVQVQFFGDDAIINAESDIFVSYVVNGGSAYRFHAGTRAFLSSNAEGHFRTLNMSDDRIYSVTRGNHGDEVECYLNR